MAGVNYRQDMPPKGGYEPFRFSRHLPNRGPSGTVIMLGGVALMGLGFYIIKKTNEERRFSIIFVYSKMLHYMCMYVYVYVLYHRALKREKLNARFALLPLLQAEEDRRSVVHTSYLSSSV